MRHHDYYRIQAQLLSQNFFPLLLILLLIVIVILIPPITFILANAYPARHAEAMNRRFDHEKLEVYRASLALLAWLEPLLQRFPKSLSVIDQLDRASTSIPLNIAEGNGKFTSAGRCRYFDNARGSALECAAALDILVAKGRCPESEIEPGKERLFAIVSMLVGLIRANSDYRMHEGQGD
jgi:four helix bundle protein